MRRITSSVIALAAGCGLLLTTASALACGGWWGPDYLPAQGSIATSNPSTGTLKPVQRQRIAAARKVYGRKLDKLQAVVDGLEYEVWAEISKTSPNAAKLKGLHKKRDQAVRQMERLHAEMDGKIRGLLTTNQAKYHAPRVVGHWCRVDQHGWAGGGSWSSHRYANGQPGFHGWSGCARDWWWD